MSKLRLVITEKCNKSCEGCCNKQFDISALPVEADFKDYECIMLTGGEPMLDTEYLKRIIAAIKRQTDAPIYVYTSKVDDYEAVNEILDMVEGLTVTLHEQDDVMPFMVFNTFLHLYHRKKSMRLNVFKDVDLPETFDFAGIWQVKDNIEWLNPHVLPEGEVLKRYTLDMVTI